jgi:hypothetical protein
MGDSPSPAASYKNHDSHTSHDSNSHGMKMMPKEYYDKEHGKSEYDMKMMKPEYDMKKEGGDKPDMGKEALEMAVGTMLTAIRENDVTLLARSFKAAYRACEMYEGEY